MPQMPSDSWFEKVPKVELHLHLEGAIPHDALWQLIQKYGGDPEVPDFPALEKRFQYRDFLHFLQTWNWKNGFLREYEDFKLISEAFASDLASQNIRYAEVFFSPSDFLRHGLETQKLTDSIRAGLSLVPQTEIALVMDVVRDRGIENAARHLAEINELKRLGVIGITIGGNEKAYPPEIFAPVYEKARQLDFHTSAHAGEAAGPESIWGAIRTLRVDRIGHGTRAIEDAALVDYLVENGIPLEVCPISNVRTRVVESIYQHPVRRYFEKGLGMSINTDDPKMFGNSLADEYRVLQDELGFSRDEIRQLILQGIRTSWLPETRKKDMAASFQNDPNW